MSYDFASLSFGISHWFLVALTKGQEKGAGANGRPLLVFSLRAVLALCG